MSTFNFDNDFNYERTICGNMIPIEPNSGFRDHKDERLVEKSQFNPSLHIQRKMFISDTLKSFPCPVSRVFFLGCGTGTVMQYLISGGFSVLYGVDKDKESLERARSFLQPILFHFVQPLVPSLRIFLNELDILSCKTDKIDFRGQFDCLVCTEVIEHVYKKDLSDLNRFMFDQVGPNYVIITTPNCEFNAWFSKQRYFRDSDHKFEFSTEEFSEYCKVICSKYDYKVKLITGVGKWNDTDVSKGYATQIAVFERVNKNKICSSEVKVSDSVTIIEYPTKEKYGDNRPLNKKVIDELHYMYNLYVEFLGDRSPAVKLREIFDKMIIKKEWKGIDLSYSLFVKTIKKYVQKEKESHIHLKEVNNQLFIKMIFDKSFNDDHES